MKIAEALSRVKALKGRLSRLFALAGEHQYFVEGEEPEFSTSKLLKEWDEVQAELRKLTMEIQRTNHEVKIDQGLTLAEAIIVLADLRSRVAQYERLIRSKPENKYLRDERVIYTAAVPLPDLLKELEDNTAAIRKLDEEIQKANWQNDLRN